MKRICAWCETEITESADRERRYGAVTHGICSPCARALKERTSVPLADFLAGLDAPVLLVDRDGHIDVYECADAALPDGCGELIHCSGCAIRLAVEHTHATGEPRTDVPATLRVVPRPGPADVQLMISTRPARGRVLLTIRPAAG